MFGHFAEMPDSRGGWRREPRVTVQEEDHAVRGKAEINSRKTRGRPARGLSINTRGHGKAGSESPPCRNGCSILDAIHEPLILLDEDLRVVSANGSFYRTFDASRDYTVGQGLVDIANRRFDIPELRKLIEEASGKNAGVELPAGKNVFPLPEGRIVKVDVRRVEGASGQERLLLLAFEDITDLARAEEQLRMEAISCMWRGEEVREHAERFRTLVETMNDGLAVRDEIGVLTYVNDKLCDMLGYVRDEVVGHPVADFLDEANELIYREQVAKRERGEHAQYDLTWTGKNGRKVCTIMSAKPVFDADGHARGSFAVVTDITARKATEAALRESEGKLRSVSSHLLRTREEERERIARELHDELGQDLAVLKHQTRFIQSRMKADRKELEQACADAMQQLETIIDNVRRIARDLGPPIVKDLGLTASLRKLAEDLARHKETKVALELAVIDGILPPEAEVNLYRILQEALTNVRKHARASHVSIIVGRTEDAILLKVADNGEGFDKADAAGNPAPNGLGLAIMEERARMINASFEIRSRAGAGAEILLRVPFAMEGSP